MDSWFLFELGHRPHSTAVNNMAEIWAVRQGLMLSWDMGFEFISLEPDYITVINWLITDNVLPFTNWMLFS